MRSAQGWVPVLLSSFDGAAITRHVWTDPQIEQRRIPLVAGMVNMAGLG